MFKNNKDIKLETVEEAKKRGVKVQTGQTIMPNSIVFPDKYGMERRKRRTKYKSDSKKVNVQELLAKCNPEQKKKLIEILRKQGVTV